ncbi:PAS domain-containing sensor histidine kinase [Fusibacter ferrireducens]|uniref:histidine kinase n=1 Tax=Fusibacter ferrireducens TaxID=2785058 RepID=A0ABR9ZQI5_9FIRM|nr:PAS domain-containing sensor histidine kinase [Fusibacter ferrireducens]MBF4691894.1 PAS domain-containing protein [Fusibacter ferrireducens]
MKKLSLKRNSIQFRIPFFISIFALICVLVTGLVLQLIFRYKLEDNIESKNMIISEMISNELTLYLKNATDTVITAANFSSQSSGDLEQIKSEIFRIYDNFNYFDLIFFMNQKAQMVFSKPSNENVQGRLYTDRNYYWDIMGNKEESTISELLVSSVLGKPHFITAAPVKNKSDEIVGLIGAGIPLGNIEKILKDVKLGFNGKLWITDAYGAIVIHPDYDIDQELIAVTDLGIKAYDRNPEILNILKNHQNINTKYTIGDDDYYASITFLEGYNWMIVVEQNKDTVNREILNSTNQLVIIQTMVLMFALIIGLVLARWITLPIKQLVQQVRALPTTLKYNEGISVSSSDSDSNELLELSHAFVEMGQNLKNNLSELESSVISENRIQQYLKNILASVHSGIIVADSKYEITIFNAQATKITGLGQDEMIGHDFFEILEILKLNIKQEVLNVIHYDQHVTDLETTLIASQNKYVSISYTCSRVTDPSGNYLGIVLQFRDITAMKILEQELRKEDRIHTIGELSASIIHDIGNPLAGMANLIELLKDKEISEDSQREVLNLLSEEVNDLNILVINFLDFVRSSNAQKTPVDLVKIIKSSLDLLKSEIDTNCIRLVKQIPSDPIILNLESRSVKQAIINILKNASQAIENKGSIVITLTESETHVTLTIEDTGKGMSEEVISKLFYPFYTTREDGTGLGLFIAYNALKENGCILTVESEIGRGSIFKINFKKD